MSTSVSKPSTPLLGRAVAVERDVPCRMRDGVILYADVYRPAQGQGPWPVENTSATAV